MIHVLPNNSIIHEIQTTFDNNPTADVRGVFLDISKAFDKVWDSGLLFKLQSYGVEGQLLAVLKDYHYNRKRDQISIKTSIN